MPRPQPTHRAPRSAVQRRAAQRRAVRTRRRRVGALAGSLAVTVVIGTTGVVSALRGGPADARTDEPSLVSADLSGLQSAVETASRERTAEAAQAARTKQRAEAAAKADESLPAASGQGRRIVFSESRQRVWLVEADGTISRTYPVSGSKHDNLDPGTYAVQSRTENATAYDYSGTMKWFVRFTTGKNAPIGFHSVPVDNSGRLEQTKAQLGTPLSSGCVRQWADDAKALWDWAPVGTRVVVTA
ncbi:MAG: L,D-transpeptidase [Aeromicrobium erythreum]